VILGRIVVAQQGVHLAHHSLGLGRLQLLAHGGVYLGLLDIFPDRIVVFALLIVEVAQLVATDRHLFSVAVAARLLLALQVALLIH